MGQNASDKNLLSKLQTLGPRPINFAFVAKGTDDGGLLLDEHVIPQAAIMVAKARSGGTTVIQGTCFKEDEQTVFETHGTPPDFLVGALEAVIHRDAGTAFDILVRQGVDKSAGQQKAYVGSEPNPTNKAGYTNLAPEGSDEAGQSNMAPNLTDTDAYVNRLVDQANDESRNRGSENQK
jgi:hypothetical protein